MLYILRYLNDPELRQRVQLQLNRSVRRSKDKNSLIPPR
jgi:TnpA family transposase